MLELHPVHDPINFETEYCSGCLRSWKWYTSTHSKPIRNSTKNDTGACTYWRNYSSYVFLRKQPPCHWLYLLLGCYWNHGRKRMMIGESAPWKIRLFKVWSQDLLATYYYQWQPWQTPCLKTALLVVILQRLVQKTCLQKEARKQESVASTGILTTVDRT